MKVSQRVALAVVGCLAGGVLFAGQAWSLTLDQVLIEDSEVGGVCQKIEGEFAVSLQAAVQYRMSGETTGPLDIYGHPKAKQFQSFSCGDNGKATVYYYEFASGQDLAAHLEAIKAVLWGEKGPTTLHPEWIVPLENVLVVVSSRSPQFLGGLLARRAGFKDVEDQVVDKRLSDLKCGTRKEASPEVCAALKDFKAGGLPDDLLAHESLLIGHSWDISHKAPEGPGNAEALYVGSIDGRGSVASYGSIKPDNDDERKMIESQIGAQRAGRDAPDAAPLLAFAKESYGKTRAQMQKAGNRSAAFMCFGNESFLRRSGSRIVLMTQSMFEQKDPVYVVAVFEAAPTSSASGH